MVGASIQQRWADLLRCFGGSALEPYIAFVNHAKSSVTGLFFAAAPVT
jgi:hypothetical protein